MLRMENKLFMNKTIWERIKISLNNTELEEEFTRKQFLEAVEPNRKITLDWYRRLLEVTGYVKRTGRGKYIAIRRIEADLTTAQLRANADLAYLLLTRRKQNEY